MNTPTISEARGQTSLVLKAINRRFGQTPREADLAAGHDTSPANLSAVLLDLGERVAAVTALRHVSGSEDRPEGLYKSRRPIALIGCGRVDGYGDLTLKLWALSSHGVEGADQGLLALLKSRHAIGG